MRRKGFTLVELLVVIGIIAVLIGILLPSLNAARRQANTVKCATALREMGNAANLYAIDNKGYFPPLRTLNATYNIDGFDYTTGRAYYFNFLAKYITKTKVGYSGTNANDASQAQNSIFWACPAWAGYIINGNALNPAGVYVAQTGFGWNAFPEFTESYPGYNEELGEGTGDVNNPKDMAAATPTAKLTTGWSGGFTHKWYKQNAYTHPADRALAGDATFYVLESRPPNTGAQGSNDTTIYGQGVLSPNLWVGAHGANESTVDMYRHGTYPKVNAADSSKTYLPDGGKVGYNILFADGHVATQINKDAAYKTIRMRFPG